MYRVIRSLTSQRNASLHSRAGYDRMESALLEHIHDFFYGDQKRKYAALAVSFAVAQAICLSLYRFLSDVQHVAIATVVTLVLVPVAAVSYVRVTRRKALLDIKGWARSPVVVGHETRWAKYEEDFWNIDHALTGFLAESRCRGVVLIDKTGQIITCVGDLPDVDLDSFATLVAADFAEGRALAELLGTREFDTALHHGTNLGLYTQRVAGRIIVAILFDSSTTFERVRSQALKASRHLTNIFERLFAKIEAEPEGIEKGAESSSETNIDRFFERRLVS